MTDEKRNSARSTFVFQIPIYLFFLALTVCLFCLYGCGGSNVFETGAGGVPERYKNGLSHEEKGEFEEAIYEYRALIKESPNSNYADDAQYRIAVCHGIRGEREKEMRAYLVLLGEYPGSDRRYDASIGLADCYYKWRKYTQAYVEYDRIMKAYPMNSNLDYPQFMKGECSYGKYKLYIEEADREDAVAQYRLLVEKYFYSSHVDTAKERLDALNT